MFHEITRPCFPVERRTFAKATECIEEVAPYLSSSDSLAMMEQFQRTGQAAAPTTHAVNWYYDMLVTSAKTQFIFHCNRSETELIRIRRDFPDRASRCPYDNL